MSILTIDPIPGAGGGSIPPVIDNPVQLSSQRSSLWLRSLNGKPITGFYLREGDTTPPIEVQVVDDSGNPIDLTGCTALFRMKPRRYNCPDGHVVEADALVPAAAAGFLSYDWANDGSDTVAGSYLASFVITDTSGDSISLPSAGGIAIEITE